MKIWEPTVFILHWIGYKYWNSVSDYRKHLKKISTSCTNHWNYNYSSLVHAKISSFLAILNMFSNMIPKYNALLNSSKIHAVNMHNVIRNDSPKFPNLHVYFDHSILWLWTSNSGEWKFKAMDGLMIEWIYRLCLDDSDKFSTFTEPKIVEHRTNFIMIESHRGCPLSFKILTR